MKTYAIIGALALNIPTLAAAPFIGVLSVAIMAICLAAIGASLGAVTGWAIEGERSPSAARVPAEQVAYRQAA